MQPGDFFMPPAQGAILWTPTEAQFKASRLWAYQQALARETGLMHTSYQQLWTWSVEQPEAFWRSVWRFCDVLADGEPEPVLLDRAMPGAQWFPGTRLNY